MKKFILDDCVQVIDADSKFEDVRRGVLTEDKKKVKWFDMKGAQIEESSTDKYKLFPNLYHPFTLIWDFYFTKLKGQYSFNWNYIKNELFKSKQKRKEKESFVKFISEIYEFTVEEAEVMIKLNIAIGNLTFIKLKKKNYIQLSKSVIEFENHRKYVTRIADELKSLSERIEYIIKHSQTKGNYREYLLRQVLNKYIPEKYSVKTGFIEGHSKQCDIIIYDNLNYSALFKEGDLVVVPEEAVRAVIEVKTTLTSDSLKEAIDSIDSVSKGNYHPAPFFKGIFAFETDFESSKTIFNGIKRFYNDNQLTALFEQLTCICVPDQCFITTYHKSQHYNKNDIAPKVYEIVSRNEFLNIESAMFFAGLLPFLDVEKRAKKTNLNFFRSLIDEIEYEFLGYIHGSKWMPKSSFSNEHSEEKQSILKRIDTTYNWFKGNYTIEDLEQLYNSYYYEIEDEDEDEK
ncbi:MAG: DUF6602 domain-containing protein [Bacteroidota bacterium]